MSVSLCKTCSIAYGVSVTQCKYKQSGVEREMKDTIWPKSTFYAATWTRTAPAKEEEGTKTSGFHPQTKISVRTKRHERNRRFVSHHVALFEIAEILLIFLDACFHPNFIWMISYSSLDAGYANILLFWIFWISPLSKFSTFQWSRVDFYWYQSCSGTFCGHVHSQNWAYTAVLQQTLFTATVNCSKNILGSSLAMPLPCPTLSRV